MLRLRIENRALLQSIISHTARHHACFGVNSIIEPWRCTGGSVSGGEEGPQDPVYSGWLCNRGGVVLAVAGRRCDAPPQFCGKQNRRDVSLLTGWRVSLSENIGVHRQSFRL